jgi:hypothetical protein
MLEAALQTARDFNIRELAVGTASSSHRVQPRSVEDSDKEAWDAMVAKQRTINEAQENQWWEKRPGFFWSMVPVVGSAREAIVDHLEGDKAGATANAVLALVDLTGEGYVAKTLVKGGAKVAGSHTWNATRKWMGRRGDLEKFQPGHHWAIPQRSSVPDAIKNQPWNIKGMPDAETHGRLHGRYAGKPRFGFVDRFVEGTPGWFKAQAGLTVLEAPNHVRRGIVNEQQAAQSR